jgi:hypothetical protein
MAIQHPEAVIGLHLSGTTPAAAPVPADATPAERQYLDNVTRRRESETGYSAISGTVRARPASRQSPEAVVALSGTRLPERAREPGNH